MDVWLSLVGPKLEAETDREAVSYHPSSVHLGLIIMEVIVWVPGLSLEIAVGTSVHLTYSRVASWARYGR